MVFNSDHRLMSLENPVDTTLKRGVNFALGSPRRERFTHFPLHEPLSGPLGLRRERIVPSSFHCSKKLNP